MATAKSPTEMFGSAFGVAGCSIDCAQVGITWCTASKLIDTRAALSSVPVSGWRGAPSRSSSSSNQPTAEIKTRRKTARSLFERRGAAP